MTARREAAEALEREALDVFRVARQLETGLVPVLDLEERAVAHGRSSIVARLRDFTKRHVDLAGLDILDEPIGQGREHRRGECCTEACYSGRRGG